MIRCRVLLFAHLAQALETAELEIELPDGATVGDALARLADEHDAIAAMRDQLAVAVNEAYAPKTTPLTDGADVALIPPVSGG